MPIQAIAIVGKSNEPLYLYDCNFEKNAKGEMQSNYAEDYFGFSEEASKGVQNNLSLDNEVCCFQRYFKQYPLTLLFWVTYVTYSFIILLIVHDVRSTRPFRRGAPLAPPNRISLDRFPLSRRRGQVLWLRHGDECENYCSSHRALRSKIEDLLQQNSRSLRTLYHEPLFENTRQSRLKAIQPRSP